MATTSTEEIITSEDTNGDIVILLDEDDYIDPPKEKILVQGTEAGEFFYLYPNITYGDILIITLLLLIFMAGIFKAIWGFIFPKIIKHITEKDV